ncbi:MAG: GIY-YIG nuclease family protein [Bacteroidales bacterium]
MNKLEYKKQEFTIQITDKAIKPVDTPKFIGVSKNDYKIYIITNNNQDLLYIGITKTYLSSRFSLGFNSTNKVGHNGYHGYKWVKEYSGKQLNLTLITFPNMDSEDKQLVETIEAELVFFARQHFGKWCECQNEIHFYNNGKELIDFSEKLFKEIFKIN